MFVFQGESRLFRFPFRDLVILCCTNLANQVRARVSPFLSDTQKKTELATNFLHTSDKLVFGSLVLLAPE